MMHCGRESMCDPCWASTPDEAYVICESVYDLQAKVCANVVPLTVVVEVLSSRCERTPVNFDQSLVKAVRERFEEDGIDIYPLSRTLTSVELEE